jgi:uncharacterized membrane protein
MKIHKLTKSAKGRIWEIDFLRGVAVVMMIVFHALYDLNYFAGYPFAFYAGFWWVFARVTAGIFVFLAGISLTLSYSRAKPKLSGSEMTRKYARRGLWIFGWGLLITALTWALLAENGAIWFGVLHLIGISIILARPLLRFRRLNLVLGIVFLCVGVYLGTTLFGFPWLIPLGFKPAGFYTLDYLPIFPWFGIVLLGLFAGNTLYNKKFNEKDPPKAAKPVCFLGRHSLFIYLLHQPILIGLLYLLLLV